VRFGMFGILGGSLEFPFGRSHDGIHSGADALVVVVVFQIGAHDVADDVAGGYIRQRPLESHANLDAHLALRLGNDQQHAVVFLRRLAGSDFCF